MKKTYKKWEKSDVNLDVYLGKEPCEIDETLFLYVAEIVPPEYSSEELLQEGEATKKVDDVLHYGTYASYRQEDNSFKYYYLGILPKFKKPKY